MIILLLSCSFQLLWWLNFMNWITNYYKLHTEAPFDITDKLNMWKNMNFFHFMLCLCFFSVKKQYWKVFSWINFERHFGRGFMLQHNFWQIQVNFKTNDISVIFLNHKSDCEVQSKTLLHLLFLYYRLYETKLYFLL